MPQDFADDAPRLSASVRPAPAPSHGFSAPQGFDGTGVPPWARGPREHVEEPAPEIRFPDTSSLDVIIEDVEVTDTPPQPAKTSAPPPTPTAEAAAIATRAQALLRRFAAGEEIDGATARWLLRLLAALLLDSDACSEERIHRALERMRRGS